MQNTFNPRIIAFVHHKGGTGKTTACINVAGWLQKMGKKVLVIDLDPQGNATAGLGLDRRSLNGSLYDVFFGNQSFTEIIQETESGLHVAPSSSDLLTAEMHISEMKDPIGLLSKAIQEIREHYDYILMDVPPGSTILMINGIIAADALMVAIDAGIFGVETLETLHILLEEIQTELKIEIPIAAVLLRAYPAKLFGKDPTKRMEGLLKEFLAGNGFQGIPVYKIPYSQEVHDSQMKGLPLAFCNADSSVSESFAQISRDLVERERDREAAHG